MAVVATNFTAIPALPTSGVSQSELAIFSAIKENMEILIGARPGDDSGRALLKFQANLPPIATVAFTALTARGGYFVVNNQQVASAQDVANLIQDVARLAQDVAAVRNLLNALITKFNS